MKLISSKQKLPSIIAAIYVLLVVFFNYLSLSIEYGHTCFAADPYWNYGLVNLPCYFFDTLTKTLLEPTHTLLMFLIGSNGWSGLRFSLDLIFNTVFIYLVVRFIQQRLKNNP